jgi:hypothetical protein
MWFESEDAVVPKGKSCRTVPNSKQITWHRFDDNALEEAGDKEPPTEEEVCVYMEAITDETKSKNERKEIGKFVGWTHVGLLYHFVIMYHFCLIKDVPPDLMHLSMVLIKDLLRITVTILSGWQGQPEDNPCGINEWDFGFWLHMLASFFRRNMHPGFSTGRRYFKLLSHEAIASWTAEECLIWLRLQWRFFLQQFIDMYLDRGLVVPEILLVLVTAWELLAAVLLPYMDRRGVVVPVDELKMNAVKYQAHMRDAKVGGKRAFSLGFLGYTAHSTIHLHKYVQWWGALWELWCFKFERVASELTQMLTGWSTQGGAAEFLARRLALKRYTTHKVQEIVKTNMRSIPHRCPSRTRESLIVTSCNTCCNQLQAV